MLDVKYTFDKIKLLFFNLSHKYKNFYLNKNHLLDK